METNNTSTYSFSFKQYLENNNINLSTNDQFVGFVEGIIKYFTDDTNYHRLVEPIYQHNHNFQRAVLLHPKELQKSEVKKYIDENPYINQTKPQILEGLFTLLENFYNNPNKKTESEFQDNFFLLLRALGKDGNVSIATLSFYSILLTTRFRQEILNETDNYFLSDTNNPFNKQVKDNLNFQYSKIFHIGFLSFLHEQPELFKKRFPDYSYHLNGNKHRWLPAGSQQSLDQLTQLDDYPVLTFSDRVTVKSLTGNNNKINKLPNFSLSGLLEAVKGEKYKHLQKKDKPVIFASTISRPLISAEGRELGIGFSQWSGIQFFDIDIKDTELAIHTQEYLHTQLQHYPWYIATALSTSGNGLHIYTYEKLPQYLNILKKGGDSEDLEQLELEMEKLFKFTYSKKAFIINHLIQNTTEIIQKFNEVWSNPERGNEHPTLTHIDTWIDLHSNNITQPLYITSDGNIRINYRTFINSVSIFYPCKKYQCILNPVHPIFGIAGFDFVLDDTYAQSEIIKSSNFDNDVKVSKGSGKNKKTEHINQLKSSLSKSITKSDLNNPGKTGVDINMYEVTLDNIQKNFKTYEDFAPLLTGKEHLDYVGRWNVANTLAHLFKGPGKKVIAEKIFDTITDQQIKQDLVSCLNTAYSGSKRPTHKGIQILRKHGIKILVTLKPEYINIQKEIELSTNNPLNTNMFNTSNLVDPNRLPRVPHNEYNDKSLLPVHFCGKVEDLNEEEYKILNHSRTKVRKGTVGNGKTLNENGNPILNLKVGSVENVSNKSVYLSDYDSVIQSFTSKYPSTFYYLIAPPGSGKTEYAKRVARRLLKQSNGSTKTIIFEPFISIINNKFAYDEDFYIISNVNDFVNDIEDGKCDNKIFVAVFDKFLQSGKLEFDLLAKYGITNIYFDESHFTVTSSFRERFIKFFDKEHFNNDYFLGQTSKGKQFTITLMTGTPVGEHTFLDSTFNLRTPIINFDNVEYQRSKRHKEFEIRVMENNFKEMDEAAFNIMLSNHVINSIEKFGRKIIIVTQGGERKVDIMKGVLNEYYLHQTMKKAGTKEAPECFKPLETMYYARQNRDLRDVVEINRTSEWPEGIDVLYCSPYLSAGIDINTPGDYEIIFIGEEAAFNVDQYCNRIRRGNIFGTMFVKQYARGQYEDSELIRRDLTAVNLNDNHSKELEDKILWFYKNIVTDRKQKRTIEIDYTIRKFSCIRFDYESSRYIITAESAKQFIYEQGLMEYHKQVPVILSTLDDMGYDISVKTGCEFLPDEVDFSRKYVMEYMKEVLNDKKTITTGIIQQILSNFEEVDTHYFGKLLSGTMRIEHISRITEYYDGNLPQDFDIENNQYIYLDKNNNILFTENIKAVEKILPILAQLSKLYDMDQIRDIFSDCKRKNGTYNMTNLMRIKNAMFINRNFKLDTYNPITNVFIKNTENLVKEAPDYDKDEITGIESGSVLKSDYMAHIENSVKQFINTSEIDEATGVKIYITKEDKIIRNALFDELKGAAEELVKTILEVGRFSPKTGIAKVCTRPQVDWLSKYEKEEMEMAEAVKNLNNIIANFGSIRKVPKVVLDMGSGNGNSKTSTQ